MQRCRPAKKSDACSNHKSKPPCEIADSGLKELSLPAAWCSISPAMNAIYAWQQPVRLSSGGLVD
jgi:hypothetical protein